MKVVHLWKSDSSTIGGGGAVAMRRLHVAIKESGIDSKILCNHTHTSSADVQALQRPIPLKIVEKLLEQVTSRLGLNDIHRLGFLQIKQNPIYKSANLLHFHGTHSNFLNYLALPTLTKHKVACFTLHDMWNLTGHCSYSFDCDRWKIGCGRCPYPDIFPAIKRDATALEWKLKDWVYRQLNLTIISPSKWLTKLAQQSPLTNRFPIHHIPYGIDTTIFEPLASDHCRLEMGIPLNKKVLMFASVRLNNKRKGGDLLIKALQSLPQSLKKDTVLVVFGHEAQTIATTVGIPVYDLGYLYDDRAKAVAYSTADLFLFPTRADAFGLVSIESQACGTPVVSFDVDGVPDHVRPGVTGYLAEPENAQDFRDGIVELLEDEVLRHQMSRNCRAIAKKEYSLALYSQRHLDLYSQLLEQQGDKSLELTNF